MKNFIFCAVNDIFIIEKVKSTTPINFYLIFWNVVVTELCKNSVICEDLRENAFMGKNFLTRKLKKT